MLRAAMLDADLPQWLDKVDIPTVAVLTLDDGECITADILGFNDDRDELIVDVVSPISCMQAVNGKAAPSLLDRLSPSRRYHARGNHGHIQIPAGIAPSRFHALP